MFCPKCGNQISEGVKFCPKCGNALGDHGNNLGNPAMPQIGSVAAGASSRQEPSQAHVKRGLIGTAVVVLVLLLCLGTVAGLLLNRKTLTGVWKVQDISSTGVSLGGLDLTNAADLALKSLLDLTEESRLAFVKSGELVVAASEGRPVAMMTYEKKDKESLTLRLSVSVPFVGTVSADYDCGYRFIDKDHLVLSLKGVELVLEKDREGKPREYLKAAEAAGFSAEAGAAGTEGSQAGQGDARNGTDALEEYGEGLKENLEDGLGVDVDQAEQKLMDGLGELFGK